MAGSRLVHVLCREANSPNQVPNGLASISAEDAYALAAALERSLDDIPDGKIDTDWDFNLWLEDELPEWFSPEERELVEDELQDGLLDIRGIHPLEFFAGDERSHLVQFIRFCHLGSFEIL